MMYHEFLNLTSRKVSFSTYTSKIEPLYHESSLSKQDFCAQYIKQTKRPRTTPTTNPNYTEFNQDKFISAKKFSTAIKALSKMVQGDEDGKIFYISDILYNYEQGLKNPINVKGKDYQQKIEEGTYYDFWQYEDETFFRLQIELMENGEWYIDCGYKFLIN